MTSGSASAEHSDTDAVSDTSDESMEEVDEYENNMDLGHQDQDHENHNFSHMNVYT